MAFAIPDASALSQSSVTPSIKKKCFVQKRRYEIKGPVLFYIYSVCVSVRPSSVLSTNCAINVIDCCIFVIWIGEGSS